MTYNDQIIKTEQPLMVELYEFTVGGITTRYTSHDKNVLFLSELYKSVPIKRGDFTFSQKLKSNRVQIQAPIDENISRFVANAPPAPIFVKICGLFPDDGECKSLFEGEIIDVSIDKNVGTVVAEASTEIFRNKTPRIVFQSFCNHMLFDGRCGLNKLDFETIGTLTEVTGSQIKAAAFATKPDGFFTMGFVEKFDGSDIRLVTDHVGNRLTLQVPFDSSIMAGIQVKAYPGDDHSPETCRDKFNNLDNFLGFPYIPPSNPTLFGFKTET